MPIFLKIDAIPGSSTDDKFKDQIQLTSFQLGAGLAVSSASNGDRTHDKAHVSEAVATKTTDKASEALFKSLLKGDPVGKGTVSFVAASKGESIAYLTLELEQIIVSGFSLSSGGDFPTESISLNFTKFDWAFTGRDGEHSGSAKHLIYDLATNKVG